MTWLSFPLSSKKFAILKKDKSERAEELAPYGIAAHALGALEQPRKRIRYARSSQNASRKYKLPPRLDEGSIMPRRARFLKLIVAEIEKEGLAGAPLLALLLGMVVNIFSAFGNTNGAMKLRSAQQPLQNINEDTPVICTFRYFD